MPTMGIQILDSNLLSRLPEGESPWVSPLALEKRLYSFSEFRNSEKLSPSLQLVSSKPRQLSSLKNKNSDLQHVTLQEEPRLHMGSWLSCHLHHSMVIPSRRHGWEAGKWEEVVPRLHGCVVWARQQHEAQTWIPTGQARTMPLKLWVATPFTGVTYQTSGMSDVYVIIHNSSQITVMK